MLTCIVLKFVLNLSSPLVHCRMVIRFHFFCILVHILRSNNDVKFLSYAIRGGVMLSVLFQCVCVCVCWNVNLTADHSM